MANTTNFGWETPDDTDLVKDGAAAIRTLGGAIDTSLVDLKGGTTDQVLAKNSNTDMDFKWVTSDDANAIQNAIVDAKGDLISASAADTPARLAVGNNGETLVADSAASTGLRWQGDYSAGKNLVINGNMNLAQRGTSISISAGDSNTYLIDRWQFRYNNLGAQTYSQETDAPTGFNKSAKILFTTADATPAAGDFALFRQLIEGQNLQGLEKGTATAKPVTLSFWVKSNVTGTYVVSLTDQTNSRQISATYTISASATWEKKTVTYAGDTTGAIANTSNSEFQVLWWLGAGSNRTSGTLQTSWGSLTAANEAVGQVNVAATVNNYWQITGIQLEIGSVATQFQLSSGTFAGELAACQRYFQVAGGAANYSMAQGQATATTTAQVYFKHPVELRSNPTLSVQGTLATDYNLTRANGTYSGNPTGIALGVASTQSSRLDITGTANLVAGDFTNLQCVNSSAKLFFSSEL